VRQGREDVERICYDMICYVCDKEERKEKQKRERERERERVCVCVSEWVSVNAYVYEDEAGSEGERRKKG
jgi:hypothetical protein